MNPGITLKAAEKIFGPALPGAGRAECTLSAVRYAGSGKGKYAGVAGIDPEAKFYVHFPTPIDWELLTSKKGTPDFVSDLRESGPQGEQGRAELVERFMEGYSALVQKRRQKEEAARKKNAAAKLKEELALLRPRLAAHEGKHQATLIVNGESFSLPVEIKIDAKGKIKITASL